MCNVRLRVGQARFGLLSVVRVHNGSAEFLGEVGTVDHVSLLDGAADGCVPAVVAEGGEEGLVDGAASKLAGKLVTRHHVVQGVFVSLGPELVKELDVVLKVEGPMTSVSASHT